MLAANGMANLRVVECAPVLTFELENEMQVEQLDDILKRILIIKLAEKCNDAQLACI